MYTHLPVLVREILDGAYVPKGATIVDGTLGLGGHALSFVSEFPTIAHYYGCDLDTSAIAIAKSKLSSYPCVHYIETNYSSAAEILRSQGVTTADTILLDLGVSSMQLDAPERGFSFRFDAPLNMRLDGKSVDTAGEYINTVSEDELVEVLRELGEESYATRIAAFIVENRALQPIETTFQLRDIVYRAYPVHKRFGRVHPATKTFQALRIAVNGELSHLASALKSLSEFLSPGGRLLVVSFHSLEDRIVKQAFRELQDSGGYNLITKNPSSPVIPKYILILAADPASYA